MAKAAVLTTPTQSGVPSAGAQGGPVVLLTYAHAGAEALTGVLSASKSLACTSATGLLPLCHRMVGVWGRIEERDSAPSALAMASVRSMASTMMATIQAKTGAERWCETAFASTAAAKTFLQVFPATRFLCLHRSLGPLLAEATATYPWGFGQSPFWAYSGDHPGNNVAMVAAYWVACSQALLEFEAERPASCLSIRHEQLVANPTQQAGQIFAYLGLDNQGPIAPGQRQDPAGLAVGHVTPPSAIPLGQLTPQLRQRVTELHARLGYALSDATTNDNTAPQRKVAT